ncbi:MAG: hypothetical protein JWO62_2278 [Acidimicrobiaceae bacterium]|nr:hypothetical protein [Acidimicrobiaceae bacterium]
MYLAYVDESGNGGLPGSRTFSLGVVMVESERWPDVFDELIDYRRFVFRRFKVPVRAELKANYLLRNGGSLRPLHLSEPARYAIYRGHLRLQAKLELTAFAIVIDKVALQTRRPGTDPRDVAWEYLLQRLERFTTKNQTEALLVHDEGDSHRVRLLARKARRAGSAGSAFGLGYLRRPARRVIDDPVPRDSTQSYFIQMADLNAYAAFRHIIPPPPRAFQVVPQGMWDELGEARLQAVNTVRGGPAGIVVYP